MKKEFRNYLYDNRICIELDNLDDKNKALNILRTNGFTPSVKCGATDCKKCYLAFPNRTEVFFYYNALDMTSHSNIKVHQYISLLQLCTLHLGFSGNIKIEGITWIRFYEIARKISAAANITLDCNILSNL